MNVIIENKTGSDILILMATDNVSYNFKEGSGSWRQSGLTTCGRSTDKCAESEDSNWTIVRDGRLHQLNFYFWTKKPIEHDRFSFSFRILVRQGDRTFFEDISFPFIPIR